ncbi:MAG: flagellin [Bryobacteraceae bacterium]
MSFSINTNIASLQAQENLRMSTDFQAKTINRVTSGLRIVNSGDDAAGLAIANGYRSDISVLTQGVRNANDGISLLQIIDGGMNNISQLLDRARTLATQSASGTFTGDRNVLNDEFKSVVAEIDRQSQVIGLNTGGSYARNLSVFVGGGKGISDAAIQTNGTLTIDLSGSTVDANSLGLKGVQAQGTADLSGKTTATTVTAILTDVANQASLAQAGYTDFYLAGPGFNGTGANTAIRVSVNTAGISSASNLVNAINSAIDNAGNVSTQQATAFKNAGIRATVVSDPATGKQTLAFTSPTSAFQVRGGDEMANAFMGHVTGSTGDADFNQVAYTSDVSAASSTGVNVLLNGTTTSLTVNGAATLSELSINVNTALATAGLSDLYAVVDGSNVNVFSRSGQSFSLDVTAGGNLATATGVTASSVVADSWFNSKGDYTIDNGGTPFVWADISGTNQQTVSVTATDAQGTIHSKTIQLTNANAGTIDDALKTINDALMTTSDTTLQNIVALKDAHGSTTGVRFSSTVANFNVSLGTEVAANEGIGGAGQQGAVYTAAQDGSATTADISTEQGALDAVASLAKAVGDLGKAQAVVGKGQNEFNYAVNLAQSQLSNLAAAESRIRDADLAAEAANLTKAQTGIQAGIAALAQANSAPQAVLSLLKG